MINAKKRRVFSQSRKVNQMIRKNRFYKLLIKIVKKNN